MTYTAARALFYVLAALCAAVTLAALGAGVCVWRWHRSNLEQVRRFVEHESECPAAHVTVTRANPIYDEYYVDVCGRDGIVRASLRS